MEHLFEVSQIDRLDRVAMKSRLSSLVSVLFLAASRQGDEERMIATRLAAELAHDVKARHLRHAEVHQNNVGLESLINDQRIAARVGRLYLVPSHFQQHALRKAGVGAVVDEKHATSRRLRTWGFVLCLTAGIVLRAQVK